MKNSLEIFIERNGLDAGRAMDKLQGAGIVADCCVTAADVAECDTRRAVFALAGFVEERAGAEIAEK